MGADRALACILQHSTPPEPHTFGLTVAFGAIEPVSILVINNCDHKCYFPTSYGARYGDIQRMEDGLAPGYPLQLARHTLAQRCRDVRCTSAGIERWIGVSRAPMIQLVCGIVKIWMLSRILMLNHLSVPLIRPL